MRRLFLSCLVFLLCSGIYIPTASAEFNNSDWPYFKKIANGAVFDNENVVVRLDDELLTQSQDMLRDIRVADKDDNETPYQIVGNVTRNKAYTAQIEELRIDGDIVDGSKYNSSRINDELKKSFMSIPREDIGYEVSIMFNLGEPVEIERVVLFTYNPAASWDSIEVLAGNSKDSLAVMRSKLDVGHQTWRWFKFPQKSKYQYWNIVLDVKGGLDLNEIMLLTKNGATINFVSEEGGQYRVYYGNYTSSLPEYPEIDYLETEGLTTVDMSNQEKNPGFDRDSDEDSIDYTEDNCPYIFNPSQEDLDEDGVGDVCQSTRAIEEDKILSENNELDNEDTVLDTEVKENETITYTKVNDRDSDGINNVFDNCPDVYNPSQYDKDLDGVGDACDNQPSYEKYTRILVVIFIFICLVIVFSIAKLNLDNKEEKPLKDNKRGKNNK